MLAKLARFSFRHRWLVSFIWIALLGATIVLSQTQGGKFTNNFSLPGTESQQTFDLLNKTFHSESGDTGQIVFKANSGVLSVQSRMEAGFAAAQKAGKGKILSISSPYSPEGARQVAAQGPNAGKIAFGEIQFSVPSNKLPDKMPVQIEDAVKNAVKPDKDLQVEFGGFAFQEIAPPQGGRELYISLGAAVLILLIAFGSVLAMGLSMFTALLSLGLSLSGLAILARFMDVVTFAPLVAAMIGLGVGIDYALFIVTRYRQGLREGRSAENAAVVALSTAGRAVLFAGSTVIISLMGIFLMGLSFMNGLAVGAGLAVLITMLASITLLPALLGFIRTSIDKLSIHFFSKNKPPKPVERTLSYRWSRKIQRHPLPFVLICLIILGTLMAPAFKIRLGNSDAGNGPSSLTTRRAYDLLSDAFGPGYNGPLLVAASFRAPESYGDLQKLQQKLAGDPGVAAVSPVIPNNPTNPTAAIIQVYGKYPPQDIKTDRLVTHVRNDIIKPLVDSTGIVIHSGGPAAVGLDLTHKLTQRLPVFFGAVILLSFLLLMAAFRSVLVPIKAAIMNVLAIGAAFGVLVAVFQWGWGASLIGVDRTGPIAAFTPMLLFAILFGLSMDYEVFLLSRIKEEHQRTGNNALAVADGLASTARVITAAAAIMVTVFFSFVFQNDLNAKLVGLGLAVSVFLDATIVRMILVPATMELLGEANWWLPRWLDAILPKINIEAPVDEHPPGAEVPGRVRQPAYSSAAAAISAVDEEPFGAAPAGRTVTGVGVPPGFPPVVTPEQPRYRTITPPPSDVPLYGSYRAPAPRPPAVSDSPSWASEEPAAPEPPAAPVVPGPFAIDRPSWYQSAVERVTPPSPVERLTPPAQPINPAVVPVRASIGPNGRGRPSGELQGLLWDLPFKAGKATVRENLEELLRSAIVLFHQGPVDRLDVSRISGYLELEQRFGRVRKNAEVDYAAHLLVGALAAPDDGNGDSSKVATEAVRIVLEGIQP